MFKRCAQYAGNEVINIAVFEKCPLGWVDVTYLECAIGYPIKNGVPVPRPSKWHTRKQDKWELTPENKALKTATEELSLKQNKLADDKDKSKFKDLTHEEAITVIDSHFAPVPDSELKVAVYDVLVDLLPLILK